MAMLVSTAPWRDPPPDQDGRCRHFVPSLECERLFSGLSRETLRELVDAQVHYARGGPVGEFDFGLLDVGGDTHELRAWTFYNQHYLLTLVVEKGAVPSMVVVSR